jgi:PKD domain
MIYRTLCTLSCVAALVASSSHAYAQEAAYAGAEGITPLSSRGVAPHTVTFNIIKDPYISYVLMFGDTTPEGRLVCRGSSECTSLRVKHVYTKPGFYVAELYRVYEDDAGKISSKSLRGLAGRSSVRVVDAHPPAVPELCAAWFNGCAECSRGSIGSEMQCPKKRCYGALREQVCRSYLHVNEAPVVVSVVGPASIEEGFAHEWQAAARDPEGETTLAYAIEWGDEEDGNLETLFTKQNKKKPTFAHTYETPGTYTITVRAQDSKGGVGKKSTTVVVRDAYAQVTCAREYVPICGERNVCATSRANTKVCEKEQVTYSNECSMHKSRAKKVHAGAC